MTLPEALRADSCTFPTYTLALHKRAANEIETITLNHAELEDRSAEYEAELARVWGYLERIVQHIPATHEDYHIIKDIFHTED